MSTILFVLFIIVAHILATNHYDFSKNTVSDLGSQKYGRKLIMQTGFLLFGLSLTTGIVLNGLTWRVLPIFVYGLSIAMTGIFCTKPFFEPATYSATQSTLHSTFAQIAGISFSAGILTQLFFVTDYNTRLVHLFFFVLIIGFSILFWLLPNYQGIVQRLLYLTSFIWLIKYYKP